jgi:DNA-binding MarR family transcriptional regulator/predicted N-acetyltransferase YhbS
MDASAVRQVRSFNRTLTERIGALDDHYLGRGRPLGESRVLWEVGDEGAEVRALRARLALDSGYLSRVLRALERQRLVRVRVSGGDGRVRQVELTPRGRAERAVLDRRSDALAAGMLAPLDGAQRARLLAAMADVERLLHASMVRFAVEDPASADSRWCLEQYFAELRARFEGGFDPSRSLHPTTAEFVAPEGAWLVARLRGRPVACGALRFHGDAADLKRMWVARDARGLGLGRRLLAELERQAREGGAAVVRLETNRALREALALYRSAGYVEVAPFNAEAYAHHWFEKPLARGLRRSPPRPGAPAAPPPRTGAPRRRPAAAARRRSR